ncbi:OmpP1/FadL family transporter [Phocaeicola sp.]
MKKLLLIGAATLIVSIPTFAGGILTNTNQHASFLRMIARGASIDIDGVYSNPAGLAFLPQDGFYLSLTGQSAYQTREITSTYPMFQMVDGQGTSRLYKGTASAPFVPSFQGAYKKGDWTVSASFAITGGGGKASFDTGLPMFDALVMGLIHQSTGGQVTPDMYSITSAMDGKQYIYGAQLGLSYKINDWLSVFAGGRMNYVNSGYEGFLNASFKQEYSGATIADIRLNCDQTGWGLTPIIGADVKLGKWNFGMKYEFKTNLNIENKTEQLDLVNVDEKYLAAYQNGVNTPNDIPALLTIAAGYEFLPTLRASVEYHFFDDKSAGMANGKQQYLTKGSNEYLAGIEWDATKQLTLSCGYQNTDYGLSNNFQTDTSFYCDSYSIGLGAKIKMNERLNLNVAYFWSNYDDYTKNSDSYNGTGMKGTDVYARTNKVFGLSVDYHF